MHAQRTTTRRRSRAVLAVGAAVVAAATAVLPPTAASADPGSVAEAAELMAEAAQQLTAIEAQVHEAEEIVASHQQAAAAAADQARAAREALAVHEPQIRAIVQSSFTGQARSRVAAFLTSDSADELVQQMTTLDMIATHTNSVITTVAAARAAADEAQAVADQAAATAQAGLAELQAQQAEVERRAAEYQSDYARLSAAEQDRVSTMVAGPKLAAPTVAELPVAPGSAAATAIQVALSQVGAPYRRGATGPDAFDCSGLTSYAYAAAGIALPRTSSGQSKIGPQLTRGELQPGDLVFYYSPISHVALYIGNGMIVHARTYGTPLSVTTVDQGGFRFGVRPTA
ncbi:Cell wall-associated hydrolase, NlpC family [Blastococcus sp. DSM 46786]|uniref:C40 family peptidase n=1 Tax=Blastococcus sp. DSM 46786 TaxID=1798227 RepID=UPI0008CF7678|nr:C40 family peptidase [Blastococcus sp. DSM 46786]SEK94378.1 Cell wall-associated hydrolase, NlpC family [Blastococcus sp. DSM 46786]